MKFFFLYTPCVSGEFLCTFGSIAWNVDLPIYVLLRSSVFLIFLLPSAVFPPYLYGFHGVFGSFVPSPLWARNRLFLPVAGRVGSTLFLCVRCLVSGNTVVWFEVCRYGCCNSCWFVLSFMSLFFL